MKTRGLEGYAVFNQELNPLLSLLRTRKVLQQTNILLVTDRELPPLPVLSCMDVNMLKDRFGIGCHFVSYREFANEMDIVLKSKEWSGKAEERAERLIKNAEETHIDRQYVKRSFEFYYAIKHLMQKYGCNAFTVECFELCASRLADKYLITPCLVHTLLKDEGIASACEGDLNALLAMRLLMSVANKSSFMGNPIVFSKDQLVINHSVPGIKMAGYDKPDLPYHLRHFVESGWGTKVMIDFSQLEEKTVTLARFDPLGTKIYLAKGEIIGCMGFNKGTLIGCSLAAQIKVPDARECLRKLSDFGSHLSMVYGDYTREMGELADMMGLEVVYAT
jgi:L-fucose isomerase-like protein